MMDIIDHIRYISGIDESIYDATDTGTAQNEKTVIKSKVFAGNPYMNMLNYFLRKMIFQKMNKVL